MRTLHGMQTRGFPNLFIMGPQQGAFTVNYPHLLDEQAKHITYILKHATENKIKTFEPSEEAESQWVDTIIAFSRMGREFLESCTPGLLQQRGQPLEPERAEQLLRRRLDPVLPDAAAVARRGDLEGAGARDLSLRAARSRAGARARRRLRHARVEGAPAAARAGAPGVAHARSRRGATRPSSTSSRRRSRARSSSTASPSCRAGRTASPELIGHVGTYRPGARLTAVWLLLGPNGATLGQCRTDFGVSAGLDAVDWGDVIQGTGAALAEFLAAR